nr:hypothetical protein [Bacillus rubiinfantis]
MKRLHRIAGLNENLTPDSLRHTHTSLLNEARVSLEQIIDCLGITVTISRKTYTPTSLRNEKSGFPQVCTTHKKPLILGEKC